MAQLFARLNISEPYAPTHSRDLGELSKKVTVPFEAPHPRKGDLALKTAMSGRIMNQTIAEFGLRSDVLFLHGQERVDYFYDEETEAKVRSSWWKDDVERFGEYRRRRR